MSKALLYIACPSSEFKRARMWAARCEGSGVIELSHRWFDTAHEWTGRDGLLPREEQAKFVREELEAISRSHLFWLMWPRLTNVMSSCVIELGAALMAARLGVSVAAPSSQAFFRPYIIVTGAAMGVAPNPFTAVADYREVTDALGFHEAVRIANDLTRKARAR